MRDLVFPGDSEMARRMRALDWAKTPLGSVEHWPASLRTSVSTCLDCAFPIVLWWGPELVILYNDEYMPMLGPAKHPAALGQRGAAVWPEIWDVIEPMLSQVMDRGEATRSRDLLLHIDRGYSEEAYFSFSYSPIRREDGRVGGVFCPVIETTEKIIGERRLRTLRDLASKCKGAESEAWAYQAAAEILAANPRDVPFALIYRVHPENGVAALEATAGIEPGSPAAPAIVPLADDDACGWSLKAVANSGKTHVVTDLVDRFQTLPAGAWKIPPHSAMVLAVSLPGQDHPRAILVAAVSPMRALDPDYRTFFELIATQISSGLADAQALEAERQRVTALAEIDRAKTVFFSNVSHEFRTPLTLMLGPLEDELWSNPQASERLHVAHRNSLRLLKLVNTLLDFSRIEAGRVQASYEATDLGAVTADLASVFRSAIEKAGLQLVIDCPTLPEPVYIDREMWEKIVFNLLSNALKFTFHGEIAIAVRRTAGHAELTVRDTGVGIPAAELPHIFERFHRVQSSRSRTHEGTGIGLALVQELARMHGGAVTVQSIEGQGSTFTVSIRTGTAHLLADRIGAERPVASTSTAAASFVEEAMRWLPSGHADASVPADAPASSARPEHAGSTRPRVVWADDNSDMRDYVSRLLASKYDVEAVSNGHAALAAIRRDSPDLILSDVMMPELDGLGLLRAIKHDPETAEIPVILLSARAGEESRIEGAEAGADDYLVKPFSARELLASVDAHMRISRMRRNTTRVLRSSEERQVFLLELTDALRALTDPVEIQVTASRVLGQRLAVSGALYSEVEFADDGAHYVVRQNYRAEGEPSLVGRYRAIDFGAAVLERLRDGRTLVVTDVTGEPELSDQEQQAYLQVGVRAHVVVPLIKDGRYTAFLAVYQNKPRTWTAEELTLVTETAERTWAAVERARAEASLRETEARLQMALDASDLGTFVWHIEEDRSDPDARTLRLLDRPPGDRLSLAAALDRMVHPDDRERYAAAIRRAIDPAGSGTLREDIRVVHSDGSVHWLTVTGQGVFDGDPRRVVKLVGMVADISDRKFTEQALREREERLQESDRRKDEFLAMLAHELRNPLAPIRTGLELIRIAGDTPGAVERVRAVMERQVTHMVRLVDDLLDVSRITSGKIHLQRKPTSLTEIVKSAVEATRAALQAAKIHMTVNLPVAPCILDVDPTRLVQVVSNLLHNASKFTPADGHVTVSAEVVRPPAASEDGQLLLRVSDDGMGISKELLPRVFDLFAQGEAAQARPQTGLGIGLALARRLIEMHEGRIEAASEGAGGGSTFTIWLPIQKGLATDGDPSHRAASSPVPRRVLIIDDNQDAAITMGMLVDELGGQSLVVHDGAAGVQEMATFRPDVVLLDIGMSGMDGYETCRRIRRESGGSDVFIVALTGWGQQQDKLRAADAGFDAHLIKPADPATLVRILSNLDRSQPAAS